MRTFRDLSGQKFGKLLVLSRAPDHITPKGCPMTRFNCICDCGKSVVAYSSNLVQGHATSCGCARKEIVRPKKGKKPPEKTGVCFYYPVAVLCENNHKCSSCGWNPHNTELRKKRLNKILKKAGLVSESDESKPAAADC